MIVGFTGTRHGMTPAQQAKAIETIAALDPVDFLHGDCVGADKEAHDLVAERLPEVWIVGFPPTNTNLRAYCAVDEWREPRPYLERDREIVRECHVLVAAPRQMRAQQSGSGTWYTTFYAMKYGRPVVIVWPDGSSEERGFHAVGDERGRAIGATGG